MEIDHVSFSSSGGAGLVAKMLAETQRLLGHEARLTTLYPQNLHQQPFKNPFLTLAAAIDEYVIKHPNTKTMVSLARAKFELLESSRIRTGAILNLHWNQGLISNSSVKELLDDGKKIVWTLHDMAPFTGVCHHSHSCDQFRFECERCPETRMPFSKAVSVQLSKKAAFPLPESGLCIVSPSNWLAEAAQQSQVFRNQRIEVIPNPINKVFFESHSKHAARARLGILNNEIVGAAVVTQLNDPGKQVSKLVDEFLYLLSSTGREGKFLLFGNQGAQIALKDRRVLDLGSVPPQEVAKDLVASDFIASFSISETASLTVREAGALGIPAIYLGNKGSNDQIKHLKSGILLEKVEEFQPYLKDVLLGMINLSELGGIARADSRESNPIEVAKKYVELYSTML